MKIVNPLPAVLKEQAPTAPAARAPAEGGAKATAGLVGAHSAKVEISSTAASLRTNTAPAEFDADKVERITQRIAEGRFKVNAEAIADKLIANAQELLGKVQR